MEECESKGIALDVNLMPPDDDDLTDEDSDEDEDSLPKDLNHLGRGILTQDAEIVEYDTEDTMPDLTRVSLFSVFLQFLSLVYNFFTFFCIQKVGKGLEGQCHRNIFCGLLKLWKDTG